MWGLRVRGVCARGCVGGVGGVGGVGVVVWVVCVWVRGFACICGFVCTYVLMRCLSVGACGCVYGFVGGFGHGCGCVNVDVRVLGCGYVGSSVCACGSACVSVWVKVWYVCVGAYGCACRFVGGFGHRCRCVSVRIGGCWGAGTWVRLSVGVDVRV